MSTVPSSSGPVRTGVKAPAYGMPQAVPDMKFQAHTYLPQPKASWCYLDPAVFVYGLGKYTIALPKVKRLDLALEKLKNIRPCVRNGRITVAQFVSSVTPEVNSVLGNSRESEPRFTKRAGPLTAMWGALWVQGEVHPPTNIDLRNRTTAHLYHQEG